MRKVLVLTITLLALSALAVAAAEPPAAQTALASPAGVACVSAPSPEAPALSDTAADLVQQPEFLTPCPTPQLLACWRSCGQQCVAMGCSSTGTSCTLEHGCGACSCFCV